MSAINTAKEFLTDILAGGPQTVKRMKEWAGNKQISEKTLTRARQALGIETIKIDGQFHWQLAQPDHEQPTQVAQAEDTQPTQVEAEAVGQVAQPPCPNDEAAYPNQVDHTQSSDLATQLDSQITQIEGDSDGQPAKDVPVTTATAVANDNNSAPVDQLPPSDTVTTTTAVATPDWSDRKVQLEAGDAMLDGSVHKLIMRLTSSGEQSYAELLNDLVRKSLDRAMKAQKKRSNAAVSSDEGDDYYEDEEYDLDEAFE